MVRPYHAPGRHQLVLDGESRRGGAGRDAELAEDVLEVAPDGVWADDERRRDLPVRVPSCDEREHLELSRRQSRISMPRRTARNPVDSFEIQSGAEAGEGATSSLELHVRALAVTELSAG